jgi:hypothetical protein
MEIENTPETGEIPHLSAFKPATNDPSYPVWQDVAEETFRNPSSSVEEILQRIESPQPESLDEKTLRKWIKSGLATARKA